MPECSFEPGDKIVCERRGGKICATVLKVYPNGFMDVHVWQPKGLGDWSHISSGGWEKIYTKARCKEPSRSGG